MEPPAPVPAAPGGGEVEVEAEAPAPAAATTTTAAPAMAAAAAVEAAAVVEEAAVALTQVSRVRRRRRVLPPAGGAERARQQQRAARDSTAASAPAAQSAFAAAFGPLISEERTEELEKNEERVLAIAREAEDEAERIRLANEGRVQGACQIEGGCSHPNYDLRYRSRCLVCGKLLHNACANEKKLKDLISNKIYCSHQCFTTVVAVASNK